MEFFTISQKLLSPSQARALIKMFKALVVLLCCDSLRFTLPGSLYLRVIQVKKVYQSLALKHCQLEPGEDERRSKNAKM